MACASTLDGVVSSPSRKATLLSAGAHAAVGVAHPPCAYMLGRAGSFSSRVAHLPAASARAARGVAHACRSHRLGRVGPRPPHKPVLAAAHAPAAASVGRTSTREGETCGTAHSGRSVRRAARHSGEPRDCRRTVAAARNARGAAPTSEAGHALCRESAAPRAHAARLATDAARLAGMARHRAASAAATGNRTGTRGWRTGVRAVLDISATGAVPSLE